MSKTLLNDNDIVELFGSKKQFKKMTKWVRSMRSHCELTRDELFVSQVLMGKEYLPGFQPATNETKQANGQLAGSGLVQVLRRLKVSARMNLIAELVPGLALNDEKIKILKKIVKKLPCPDKVACALVEDCNFPQYLTAELCSNLSKLPSKVDTILKTKQRELAPATLTLSNTQKVKMLEAIEDAQVIE